MIKNTIKTKHKIFLKITNASLKSKSIVQLFWEIWLRNLDKLMEINTCFNSEECWCTGEFRSTEEEFSSPGARSDPKEGG